MRCAKYVPRKLFYYDKKKCVLWLERDERVEPNVTVRNFGPATSERPYRINQRIAELRSDWSGGNM